MGKRVTLEDIEKIDSEFLTPMQVAPYLGCAAYAINKQVQAGVQFPFPAYMFGTRVMIPKRPFINYHKYHSFENICANDQIVQILNQILNQPQSAESKTNKKAI